MTNIQRGTSLLAGNTSYPCDAKSCGALRGSVYPLPCSDSSCTQGDKDNGGQLRPGPQA